MDMRPMTIADYDVVFGLLRDTAGVQLRDVDARDPVRRYLERNPGLSFVAEEDGRIVGCIMGGHDGRRGYLQHLMVVPSHRRHGIGEALVSRCLLALAGIGIRKCHIEVLASNEEGARFWSRRGWVKRDDIQRFSYITGGTANE